MNVIFCNVFGIKMLKMTYSMSSILSEYLIRDEAQNGFCR